MVEKYQWHVLEDLTNQYEGKVVGVELGVRWGQTSRYLLENCPDLFMVGVDLMRVQPEKTKPGQETYDHWPWNQYIDQVKQICNNFPIRFTMLVMDTTEASKLVADHSIDWVFIDADHSYEGVSTDIENWLPKVKPQGMVTGHDIDRDCVRQAVEDHFSEYDTRGQAWNNCWWAKPSAALQGTTTNSSPSQKMEPS